MSTQVIRIIIAGTLLLHGIAHGRALIALLACAFGANPSPKLPVRSWLFPSLATRTAALIASVFWLLATLGFIAAALSFWGVLIAPDAWRQLAVVSAVISTVGIVLFSATWPGAPSRRQSTLDVVIALVVNLAVFVALLWLNWPPLALFSR
jgi:hypothetical protein